MHGFGAFAEYVTAPPGVLCRKPAELTMEEAAAVPTAAWVAIKGIRDQRLLGPESAVLVNGGGGSMGTFAIQMARARGAHVTAIDSAAKLELMRALGAERVIDYRADDPTELAERFDLVLDVYARRSVRDWRRILRGNGAYLMVGGSTRRIIAGFALGRALSREGGQKLGLLYGWPHTRQDMEQRQRLARERGHAPSHRSHLSARAGRGGTAPTGGRPGPGQGRRRRRGNVGRCTPSPAGRPLHGDDGLALGVAGSHVGHRGRAFVERVGLVHEGGAMSQPSPVGDRTGPSTT